MPAGTDDRPAPAPISGVSHVQLVVTDLAVSRAWYDAVLGLRRFAGGGPDDDYVALFHKGADLAIVLSRRVPGDDALARVPMDHLAFAMADGPTLQAWAEELTTRGIEHGGVVDEGGAPSLQLLDPDGISIELVAPAGSW
jgi:catechol 2,3-dioxygenase-like lactoylglutathione lyase family enzyme